MKSMFTYQYHQPDDYHFSLDSIHLAEFVAEEIRAHKNLATQRVLDLCAGCGVVGLELSWYRRELNYFDFVEVQDIYSDYFKKNIMQVNRPELKTTWHLANYDQLLEPTWQQTYDLIISNPPYFHAGHGMLSPSEFKNRCRFYLDSTFEKFIRVIIKTLAKGGSAYFLMRSLKQGVEPSVIINELISGHSISFERVTQIRGTDVILLRK